jgi:cytochrome c oxidase assembly protein subunit 15
LQPARAFGIAARLGATTAFAMFGLMVIGSVVRTTGSGLACPDWPLCQGRLIPPLEFHVLIEWSHRAVALLVSLLLLATAGWVAARRELRARLGALVGLAIGLLFAQVLLGALTVWKLLDPSVVNIHLAVALLLFSTLLALTLVADAHAEGEAAPAAGIPSARQAAAVPGGRSAHLPNEADHFRPAWLLPVFVGVTTLTYAQAVLGGAVSSQHAGLACPEWPSCNGKWFPPLDTPAGLHMLHRYGAYLVTVAMMIAAALARTTGDSAVRAAAALALGLDIAQVVLGVCNVLLGTPAWLSALHLATAATMLGMLVIVTYRVASLPASEPRLVPEAAP